MNMSETETQTEHFVAKDPRGDRLNDKNGKLIKETNEFAVFYLPGRSVYIDADSGTQYQPAEYVVLRKGKPMALGFWATEILRFSRSL